MRGTGRSGPHLLLDFPNYSGVTVMSFRIGIPATSPQSLRSPSFSLADTRRKRLERAVGARCTAIALMVLSSLPGRAVESDSAVSELDTLVVTESRSGDSDLFVIADETERAGLTDDFKRFLLAAPGVDRVPEAGGALLIRGQGPYDNRYHVAEVPMFSPTHFSNYNYNDRGAGASANIKHTDITTEGIGGRCLNCPAGLVRLVPEVHGTEDTTRLLGAVAGIGVLDHDLSVALPLKQPGHQYRLDFKHAKPYLFAVRSFGKDQRERGGAEFGFGVPGWSADMELRGRNRFGPTTLHQYGRVAFDKYLPSLHTSGAVKPWGVGALRAAINDNDRTWKFAAGGSRQRYHEGKRLGWIVPYKRTTRANAVMTGGLSTARPRAARLNLDAGVEALTWECLSHVLHSDSLSTKTLSRKETGADELHASLRGGLSFAGRTNAWGVDILTGVILPYAAVVLDPGIHFTASYQRLSMHMNAELRSSLPDIRGLPDSSYRTNVIRTRAVSASLEYRPVRRVELEAKPYFSWKDHCPRISEHPEENWWDPSAATPLLSRGIGFREDLRVLHIMNIRAMQNIGSSVRVHDGRREVYEWDMPWSTKLAVDLHTADDAFHVYLIGIVTAGLPWRDLDTVNEALAFAPEIRRVPNYKRIDLKLQWKQPLPPSSVLRGLGFYINLSNVLDLFDQGYYKGTWENTREYYWDENLQRHPVILEYFAFDAGIRVGLGF